MQTPQPQEGCCRGAGQEMGRVSASLPIPAGARRQPGEDRKQLSWEKTSARALARFWGFSQQGNCPLLPPAGRSPGRDEPPPPISHRAESSPEGNSPLL